MKLKISSDEIEIYITDIDIGSGQSIRGEPRPEPAASFLGRGMSGVVRETRGCREGTLALQKFH